MISRKYQSVFFVIVLSLFLSSMVIGKDKEPFSILKSDTSQPSSIVWTDDFENTTMTIDEWEFTGQNLTHWDDPYTPNVALSDGLIYCDGPGISSLNHPSTTSIGTWSLDLFLGEQDEYFMLVVFMSPYWCNYFHCPEGYGFMIDTWHSINSFRLVEIWPDFAGFGVELIDETTFDDISGWMHIDITRQSDDRMYVFLNGTRILGGINTEFDSSQYFRLYSEYYFAADNVTVSNTVDFDVAAPYWTESLDDYEIYEGEDFNETLHAFDHSGLDTWWVNDTENFAISQGGNIASVGLLPLGTYGVEVNVNDTFGNVKTGTFSIDVVEEPVLTPTTTTEITSTTTTSPTSTQTNTTTPYSPLVLMFVGIIGGVTVSIIVLVILIRRKT